MVKITPYFGLIMETSKIAVITGGTDGIGKETAISLSQKGYHIVLIARNESKANSVCDTIKQTGGSCEFILCDLSSLSSVYKASNLLKDRYPSIHLLINNAGVFLRRRSLSQDGFEMNFAVNHLSHFLLTTEILPNLNNTEDSRIINVSSQLHWDAKPNFQDMQMEKDYQMMNAYNCSKLYNIYFTRELAERLKDSKTIVNALHPGVVNTALTRDFNPILRFFIGIFNSIFFDTPAQGAEPSVHLSVSEELKGISGKYFNKKVEEPSSPLSQRIEHQKFIWRYSEELLKKMVK